VLVVALGPGDTDLLPVASLEALREAGPVQLDAGAAAVAATLRDRGVELVDEAATVAALDRRGARAPCASTTPTRYRHGRGSRAARRRRRPASCSS